MKHLVLFPLLTALAWSASSFVRRRARVCSCLGAARYGVIVQLDFEVARGDWPKARADFELDVDDHAEAPFLRGEGGQTSIIGLTRNAASRMLFPIPT